jgi:hypothetical protein
MSIRRKKSGSDIMRANLLKFGLPFLCLALLAGIAIHQRRVARELRDEIWRLQERNRTRAQQEETERAEKQRRAEEERDQLLAAQTESSQLHQEISLLEGELSVVSKKAAAETSANAERTPKPWINAGNATPAAAFETMFWSALNGDTDTLASVISFTPEGRARVESLFARLPQAQREASGTPEKVFATLLAARLPQDLSGIGVLTSEETSAGATLRLLMEHTNGTDKTASFHFSRAPTGWQLVVPASVVENYQQMLANAPTAK